MVHSHPSNHSPTPDPSLPFRQWKVGTVCAWMDHLGLYMYSAEVRKHVKSGEAFMGMTSHDLESKIGIKSSLHRKKILLALQVSRQNFRLSVIR